jgi:aryl-alcohol dehydrogenase-like predicted oxidoreductase
METVLLGTAQWGLDYGVTNALGRLTDDALGDLVLAAVDLGFTRLDTAPVYGDAERRIASIAPGFEVQTKVTASGLDSDAIIASLRESLHRLRMSPVAACLVHDWPALDAEARGTAAAALHRAKRDGLVEQIGVSSYDQRDLVSAVDDFPDIDIVQVPVSVLDQRLDGSAAIDQLRARGTRIQARSVFLQGVAVAADGRFGSHPDVVRLREVAVQLCVEPQRLALDYVSSRFWVDELVVAPTSVAELEQIHAALGGPRIGTDWTTLASTDEDLLDPRRWTHPS